MDTGEIKRDPEGNYKDKLLNRLADQKNAFSEQTGINPTENTEEALRFAAKQIQEKSSREPRIPLKDHTIIKDPQDPATKQVVGNVDAFVKGRFGGGGEATPPTA